MSYLLGIFKLLEYCAGNLLQQQNIPQNCLSKLLLIRLVELRQKAF